MTTTRNKQRGHQGRVLLAALCFAASVAHAAPLDEQLASLSEATLFVPAKALSALRRIETQARSAPLPARAQYLRQLSEAERGIGMPAQALATAEELIALGVAAKDPGAQAKGLLAKAAALDPGHGHAHQLIRQAERLAAETRDRTLQVQALIACGKAYASEGDFSHALERLLRAVALARQHGSVADKVGAMNALAILYGQIKEFDKGFKLLEEATPLAATLKSPGRMSTLTDTEYGLAVQTGQNERGLRALLAGLAHERQIGADTMIATSLINLADCYLRMRDYPRTISYATDALKLSRKLRNPGNIATAQLNLGQALIATGRIEEGKRQIEAGVAWYEKLGDKPELQETLVEYGAALERAGDLAGAIRAYRRERALSNELFEERRQQAMQAQQQHFEADSKERQIQALQRENALKSAQLESQQIQRRLWALLAVVLALAAGIVMLLYRKVRQANDQLQVKNLELKHQSSRDPLTGLYNRRHFQEFMRSYVGREPTTQVGALFLLDIDHFKHINDTYGHAAGDAVLRSASKKLHDILRDTDMIVRWGGEEFVAFLPAAPAEGMDEVARRLLCGLSAEAVPYQDTSIPMHVSIGYAPFPLEAAGHGLSWERAINLVDMALYLAKSHGRNRAYGVVGFADSGVASIDAIEQDLESAWRAGQVSLSVVLGETGLAPALSAA